MKIHSKLGLILFVFSILLYACSPKTAQVADASKATEVMSKEEVATEVAEVVNEQKEVIKDSQVVPTLMSIPVDADIRKGKLDNGIRYIVRKNQKPEDRAELRLVLNAGSMQEDDDQQGLAHFVEHMAFNGTKNFEKSELVDFLESIGTKFGPDLNAYTSFDETVYMLQVRTDSTELLNKGLLILEDWANGITFDHEEIDKERGVVESEWRTRLGPNERKPVSSSFISGLSLRESPPDR